MAVAMLDAGLTCSASIPCPAEMGGSIHINGTGSSIVDTIFVGRSTGSVPRKWIVDSPEGIANLVREDIAKLRTGNVTPTQGDLRCIIYGHLIRLTIWELRTAWVTSECTKKKLDRIGEKVRGYGGLDAVEKCMGSDWQLAPKFQSFIARETEEPYKVHGKYISF
jgi:hypothetical protein